MFIQTEETPNPDSIKFMPGRVIVETGTVSFSSPDEATTSQLARHLFKVDGVQGIFFGYDFITVTKTPSALWPTLKPHVLTTIMDHFVAGFPALDGNTAQVVEIDEADPIIKQIRELIETRVRPAVAMDGGDILFDRFEDGIVYLQMRGACSGCPSSSATLKSGIENMLRHYVPEVLEVRPVE